MSDFELPKYLTSLIAAINDGARAAQAGAIVVIALGVYLLAVAISTTDEDLLLGHTTNITQLGVQVSPAVTFAIAPLVFVAVHVFTLIRYDMLGTNLRQFHATLKVMVPLAADRERCRQLLANVEFVVAFAVPQESPLYSRLFGNVARGMLAVFPVAVLLAVQVSALRYQEQVIIWAQRIALLTDLFVLVWFFRRASRQTNGAVSGAVGRQIRPWARLLWMPFLIVAIDAIWFNIPEPGETNALRQASPAPSDPWKSKVLWYLSQPLDRLLCPAGWGCRHLEVQNRLLVLHVWQPEVIAKLRDGSGDKSLLAAVQGEFLAIRRLRSANLRETGLIAAILSASDLSYAYMHGIDLRGAALIGTDLHGAVVTSADLRNAYFDGADLRGANLSNSDLSGADLRSADLRGAVYDHCTRFPADFDPQSRAMTYQQTECGMP